MRGHFEYELFDFPPGLPRFGPWEFDFGHRGRGFGPCGRGRPHFRIPGWPDFEGQGCRPRGPPGLDHSLDRHEHRPDHHRHGSPPPPVHEDGRHERPGCERRGPPEDCHGSSHHHGSPGNHGSPDHHGPSDCGRQGSQENHHGPAKCGRRGPLKDSHGSPDHAGEHYGSPGCRRQGPPEDHHGHHGPHRWSCHGPSDHEYECGSWPFHYGPRHGRHHLGPGFGRPCPRDFLDWSGFGTDRHRPHFGHRRPSPYRRPERSPARDCEDCENRPCCSKTKENRESNEDCRRKGRRSCCVRNKDQNETGDTVLVQRIVVEKAPARPQSV